MARLPTLPIERLTIPKSKTTGGTTLTDSGEPLTSRVDGLRNRLTVTTFCSADRQHILRENLCGQRENVQAHLFPNGRRLGRFDRSDLGMAKVL